MILLIPLPQNDHLTLGDSRYGCLLKRLVKASYEVKRMVKASLKRFVEVLRVLDVTVCCVICYGNLQD